MLATQFLNVVLEENDPKVKENVEQEDDESNNNTIYDIINQLDIKSQLAKILLAECTIEPTIIAQKREKPILSFEANVTPIYNIPSKKQKKNDDLSLLTSVEAVYSEGEDNDASDESGPSVPCPVCNRSFSRNCSLALHMKSHEPLDDTYRKFQCHFCPRSFTQKSFLRKHLAECVAQRGLSPTPFVQEHQESITPRRYECQFCHRSYTQKSVLKKHLVVHTGERERCNVCGAGFSQRSSLVRHAKRIHGGLLNHAIGGTTSSTPVAGLHHNGITTSLAQVISGGVHNTPILTTALSNVTHPTLGTPLIVGIPLNQLAAGKFAGTQFAGNLFSRVVNNGAINNGTNMKAVPAAIPINTVAAVLANSGLARLAKTVTLTSKPMNTLINTSSSLSTKVTTTTSDRVLVATLNKPIEKPNTEVKFDSNKINEKDKK